MLAEIHDVLAEAEVAHARVERAGVHDFTVSNEAERPVRAVAHEVLQHAGWLG